MPSVTPSNTPSSKFLRYASGIAAVTAISLTLATSASAVQPTVNLGTTSVYAVLAGAGITNTGATTISGTAGGDLGSAPTAGITGDTLITTSGTKHPAADAQTLAAKDDLVTAYDDAAGRIPATTVTADLGEQTLTQGVYKSGSSLGLTGTLTLDAENDPNAVFIFQAGSTLTVASSARITMVRGAQACNVFWQIGSSATFGTDADFIGHVFALQSITANTRAVFHGQLLARNGAVTLDTNTIVNDTCASVVPPTDEGGELPNTDTVDWLIPVSVGIGAIAIGGLAFIIRRKRR